jgi:hypothetical protein
MTATRSPAFEAVLASLRARTPFGPFRDALDMGALAQLGDEEQREMRRLLVEHLAREGDARVPWALVHLPLDGETLEALLAATARKDIGVSAAAALRERLGERLRDATIAGLDGDEAQAAAVELGHYEGDRVAAALLDVIATRPSLAGRAAEALYERFHLYTWAPPSRMRGVRLLVARLGSPFASLRLPALERARALVAVLAERRSPAELGYAPVDVEDGEACRRFLASMGSASGDYDAAALAAVDADERWWLEWALPVQSVLQNGDARAARALGVVRWPATADALVAALAHADALVRVEAAGALVALGVSVDDARALLGREAAGAGPAAARAAALLQEIR